MFRKKFNKFSSSREKLVTMEIEEEIYEDPDLITRHYDPKQKHQNNLPTEPPAIYPKRKDVAAYKANPVQVTLNPESKQNLNNKQEHSMRSVYPMGDGRFIIRENQSNIGTSRPNVSGSNCTGTLRNRKPRRSEDCVGPDPRPHNYSKVDSCCNCCCFLLLYMLIIAVGLGFYFFHVHIYYPHILEQRSMTNQTLESLKEDSIMLKKFIKNFCNDYYRQTHNQSFAKNRCKEVNSEKFVTSSLDD